VTEKSEAIAVCKEMTVIPVSKVMDKKIIIGKRRRRRRKGAGLPDGTFSDQKLFTFG
jgi:hypothetical protein